MYQTSTSTSGNTAVYTWPSFIPNYPAAIPILQEREMWATVAWLLAANKLDKIYMCGIMKRRFVAYFGNVHGTSRDQRLAAAYLMIELCNDDLRALGFICDGDTP